MGALTLDTIQRVLGWWHARSMTRHEIWLRTRTHKWKAHWKAKVKS